MFYLLFKYFVLLFFFPWYREPGKVLLVTLLLPRPPSFIADFVLLRHGPSILGIADLALVSVSCTLLSNCTNLLFNTML